MPRMSVIYIIILLILIGCGGGGDSSSGLENNDPADSTAFKNQALPGSVGNLPTHSPAESVMVMDHRGYVATTNKIVVSQLPVDDVP